MNLFFNLLADLAPGAGPPVNTTPDTNSTNVGLGIAILIVILAVIGLFIFIGYIIHSKRKEKLDNDKDTQNTEKSEENDTPKNM